MRPRIPEPELPAELSLSDAVLAAYPAELGRCHDALRRGLPVMVECEKELAPFFYRCLRDRLKKDGVRCVYLDGRPAPDAPPDALRQGLMATLLGQLRDAVRGPVGERVVVLPHLDLLTSSQGGLTAEAREVIPLLYENPEILWLGFKDPSFPVPPVIAALFPCHEALLGVPRERLRHVVTQREARKLGRGLDPYLLYKHVSGVNAVRLRRLLGALEGEDYPADLGPALAQLRRGTLGATTTVPEVDLDRDIGGYARVKERLRAEILDVLALKDALADPEAVRRVEGLIPRGMIFSGPPGTGKTLFAKAMATALGAAITVVSGPELKSRWVGESEENLRRIFVAARQSAPSVVVFDEIDSFAVRRGTFTGSGVEHSMVNQLLTEMDGFGKEELVFVVGTTNLVEALDPALLRPGRFEFHLHVPYPDADDRRAILAVHDQWLGLRLDPRALDHAVRRTGDMVEGQEARWSGDHLEGLCRQIARRRLRERDDGPTDVAAVERALDAYASRPELTADERRVVATHEAGHVVCALSCAHAPPVERISIRGDLAGALGFVRYADPAHRYVVTRGQLLDAICVLFGGREAEALLLSDVSIGCGGDLARATDIARALVERFGLGPDEVGVRVYGGEEGLDPGISDAGREAVERGVRAVLERERARARAIVEERRALVAALRDLLLERGVIERESLAELMEASRG